MVRDVLCLFCSEIINALMPLLLQLGEVFSGESLVVFHTTLLVLCARASNACPHHVVEFTLLKAAGAFVCFVCFALICSVVLLCTPLATVPRYPILHKLCIESARAIRKQRLVLGNVRLHEETIIEVFKGISGPSLLSTISIALSVRSVGVVFLLRQPIISMIGFKAFNDLPQRNLLLHHCNSGKSASNCPT